MSEHTQIHLLRDLVLYLQMGMVAQMLLISLWQLVVQHQHQHNNEDTGQWQLQYQPIFYIVVMVK